TRAAKQDQRQPGAGEIGPRGTAGRADSHAEQLTERAQINETVVEKCQAELTEVEKEQARPAAERDVASAAGSGGVIAGNQHDPARIPESPAIGTNLNTGRRDPADQARGK